MKIQLLCNCLCLSRLQRAPFCAAKRHALKTKTGCFAMRNSPSCISMQPRRLLAGAFVNVVDALARLRLVAVRRSRLPVKGHLRSCFDFIKAVFYPCRLECLSGHIRQVASSHSPLCSSATRQICLENTRQFIKSKQLLTVSSSAARRLRGGTQAPSRRLSQGTAPCGGRSSLPTGGTLPRGCMWRRS